VRRRLLGLLGFATGILGASVVLRRQFGKRRDRVDVYFADGSMVSYVDGAPEALTLLPPARDALHAAGSAGGQAADARPGNRGASGADARP
jgi:hypothetical protein